MVLSNLGLNANTLKQAKDFRGGSSARLCHFMQRDDRAINESVM
jgi:hypothetical protein